MDDVKLPLHDRRQAGRVLGERLQFRGTDGDPVVLALPRGGVAVGYEVAHALGAPLDIFVVRKLGFPRHPEYAMGAIASGGVRVMNPVENFEVSPGAIADVVARETVELQRRELLYRGHRPAIALRGREVIVVDDGLATGATMRAAVQAIRQQHPLHITVAVPVGSAEACALLKLDADEVVCASVPCPFRAVGAWYRDFPQTTDDEVRQLLEDARRERAPEH
jgi:predicted phosphoribosyltransferase